MALHYAWDFGDGFGSEEQVATHVYETAGEYTVKHTIRNDETEETSVTTSLISVCETHEITDHLWTFGDAEKYISGFSANRRRGKAPLAVKFTPTESQRQTTGSSETAQHTYDYAGSFDVRLDLVTARGETPYVTKSNYIRVS
jgi:PKD repeat protein